MKSIYVTRNRINNKVYVGQTNNFNYSDELVKQIKYSLKFEHDKSLMDIAREYNVDPSQLSELNQGHIQRYVIPGEIYPLRSGKVKNTPSAETIQSVMDDLIHNDELSIRAISRKHNISASTVSNINLGNSYHNESLEYPLRPLKDSSPMYNKTIPIPVVREIEDDLANTTLSLRSIADKHGTTYTQVHNLNNGYITRYKDPDKEYPLRDLRRRYDK